MSERSYWAGRQRLHYYSRVRRWLERLSPGESILDVGCKDTPVVKWGDFARRYTIDRCQRPDLPHVTAYADDWLTWNPPEPMSVVTCLQVIEHVPGSQLHRFVERLFKCTDRLIVTVPYCWKKGACRSHIHDPIDIPKLCQMMSRDPVYCEQIADGTCLRLLAIFGKPLTRFAA